MTENFHYTTSQLYNGASDTICALSTAIGGALAIIRVSGKNAISITDKVFRAANKKSLSEASPYTLHFGEIYDLENTVIDEVMISLYRAPHSFTGENSIEISCHGSRFIIQQILKTLIDNGCRQANPGEYTQRAFLNGKMDLSQAEAVADLIESTNRATHQLALGQLRGNFTSELSSLREQLLKITSLIELELDFSDQDVTFADRQELLDLASHIRNKISSLAHSFETGKAIKSGIPVAIVGKTNVGKSTLLNALLHEDKAIVSDIHGTTRDVIEDTTDINGITFRFIDTAGIRKTEDKIENLGIERTFQKLNEATIVLWLLDEQPSEEEEARMIEQTLDKKLIKVYNKIDLLHPSDDHLAGPIDAVSSDIRLNQDSTSSVISSINEEDVTTVYISAKHCTNLTLLEEAIYKAANIPEITENDIIVTNARHYEALTHALESINRVIDGLDSQLSGDLLSEDLRICLDQLAEITGGKITSTEVLHNIFKNFCIGK